MFLFLIFFRYSFFFTPASSQPARICLTPDAPFALAWLKNYLKFLNMSLSRLENPLPKRSSGSFGGGAIDCTTCFLTG